MTYSTRLTITFALVAAATVIISFVLLAFAWSQRLDAYSHEKAETLAEVTAALIGQSYELSGGLDDAAIGGLPKVAVLGGGMGIVLEDLDGTVLYVHLPSAASGPVQDLVGDSANVTSDVYANGRLVGKVFIIPPEGGYRSENDVRLLSYSYQAITIAGVIAVLLALVFGMIFSRGLISPLLYITSVANKVRHGNLQVRVKMEGRDELSQLGLAIDGMIESIARNVSAEHQLTTGLAHELRTPLMAMQATIEAMIDGVMPVDEKRLNILNTEVIRLGRLVEAQLSLSRLERGRDAMNLEVIDLGELVSSLVLSDEALAEEAGLSLSVETGSKILVRGDADMLRQAVINLLSNALRYTPRGGKVIVKVQKDSQMAKVIVEDTGIGISVEDIDKLFLLFWRADAGRERESGGLGIGLVLVKQIADNHHGWVDVESVLEKGTVFTLNIPLARFVQRKQKKK